MRNFNVRRKDKVILLVLCLAVNASILLNHLLFLNCFPTPYYVISVVITMSIAAFGGLFVTFVLMHKIDFNPYILHIRGWDTSAGLLKALMERRAMDINIQVSSIRSLEFSSQGNLLTIHFAEDGILRLSTEVYLKKDLETLVSLLDKQNGKKQLLR